MPTLRSIFGKNCMKKIEIDIVTLEEIKLENEAWTKLGIDAFFKDYDDADTVYDELNLKRPLSKRCTE